MAALTVGVLWLVGQRGDVSINIADYTIHMQVGIFLLGLLIIAFALLFILRIFRAIFSLPTVLARYRAESSRKKSFRALTRGLVAVAAGDAKRATQFSKQTSGLWADINGLPLLLEAQAAKLRGENGLAQNRFERLLKDNDAAFLGVRGLLKTALDENNFVQALDFARRAEKQHPKKPWIIKCVYELEIKNRLWNDALRTNQKAMKFDVYPKEKLISDRVAIYLHEHDKALRAGDANRALSEVEKAYKLNPFFVPTVTRYADLLLARGKQKKCAKIIERIWKENPHPEIAEIWHRLAPVPKGKNVEKDKAKTLSWSEKLLSFNPQSVESQIAVARTAMDLEYWGEAKAHLMVAEKIYPSASLYRLQAIVEQHSTHNQDSIHRLMERAADALPDKVWVCTETGMVYDRWSAIAKPQGSFNTISWDFAGARVIQAGNNKALSNDAEMLLIDPAA